MLRFLHQSQHHSKAKVKTEITMQVSLIPLFIHKSKNYKLGGGGGPNGSLSSLTLVHEP